MSERHGIRGDGLGVSQRERTNVVIAETENRVSPLRLNRVRAVWDVESDIDVLPVAPPGKPERKPWQPR